MLGSRWPSMGLVTPRLKVDGLGDLGVNILLDMAIGK